MSIARPTQSPLWYRIADLCPTLRPQVKIVRHLTRGVPWYVAYDRVTNRSFRFSKDVYRILIRLNGQRSIDDIWNEIAIREDEDAPVQDDVVRVLGQLYLFDMLQSDTIVDPEELAARSDKQGRQKLLKRFQNPLYLQIPLWDPDHFLNRTRWVAHVLFSPVSLLVWIAVVGWMLVQAFVHWEGLSADVAGRVLSADNLLLMVIIFPALKLIHEFGHAYAVKRYGGEVHEIGLMFLIFLPVPYVEASASSAFASKWQRALVAAAGMYAELFVAAGAMAVWLNAEPGLLRAMAFSTLFIASVSTLLFNGNPLLRFDAYYIFSDLLELPNLATRANRYWQYLVKHYAFGVPKATNPAQQAGEAGWFLLYAPASLVYRLSILIGISIFVATTYLLVGVLLAAWSVTMSVVWPLLKGLFYVFASGHLAGNRVRAIGMLTGFSALLSYGLFGLSVPYATVAQGVVIAPEQALVHASAEGTIDAFVAQDGAVVDQGAPLLQIENRALMSKVDVVDARLNEVTLRLRAAEALTPFDVPLARQHRDLLLKEQAEMRKRAADLTIHAPQSGIFTMPRALDMEASFVRRGQLLGYVLSETPKRIKVVVPQDEADLVRSLKGGVSVWLASRKDDAPTKAQLVREVPGATRQLPGLALAKPVGGPIALDPSAKDKKTALLPFFLFEITLPDDGPQALVGELAHVRFDHGMAPLGPRLIRSFRQSFLRHFGV